MASNRFEQSKRKPWVRRASFSLDALIAVILVSCTLALGLYAVKASVFVFSSEASNALREQEAMVFADYLLKNCYGNQQGVGLIKCSDLMGFSHVLDEKALAELGSRQEKAFPGFEDAFVAIKLGGKEIYAVGKRNAERAGFCVSRIALLEDKQVVLRACT